MKASRKRKEMLPLFLVVSIVLQTHKTLTSLLSKNIKPYVDFYLFKIVYTLHNMGYCHCWKCMMIWRKTLLEFSSLFQCKAACMVRTLTAFTMGRSRVGDRRFQPPLENHKLLYVSLEILVRIPSISNWTRHTFREEKNVVITPHANIHTHTHTHTLAFTTTTTLAEFSGSVHAICPPSDYLRIITRY